MSEADSHDKILALGKPEGSSKVIRATHARVPPVGKAAIPVLTHQG
jgi:hypothetical protein